MIENLTATATFPVTGATLNGSFQPKSGITAVVGENGAGKTFLSIETTRWLLYGKPALRGAAPDYKQADARGTFLIRGARYEISRGRSEWIKDANGDVIAKGAEKVTDKVVELMGYGLDVFDLCNAATQGNVQKLGDLRPAERKAIIDKVLRLTSAEQAEKACREEAAGLKREAEAYSKLLRAPGDEPAMPAEDAGKIREALQAARALRDRHEQLKSLLRPVERPVMPVVPLSFRDSYLIELQEHEELRRTHESNRQHLLAAAARGPAAVRTEEAIAQAEARYSWEQALEARGPRPTRSIEELDEARAVWDEIILRRRMSDEQATCPECGHEFRVGGAVPAEPDIRADELEAERRAHQLWHDPLPPEPTVAAGALAPRAAAEERGLIRDFERAQHAREQAAAIPVLEDKSAELQEHQQAKATLEAFSMAMLQFERVRQANEQVEAEIALLDRCLSPQELDLLTDRMQQVQAAQTARERWEADEKAFKELQGKIADALHLADEYRKGAAGIADARATVKSLIAPKISRIATVLLRDMSLGKLDNLVVDADMEVTVGGQRIETLSGAGKTVANLALRIAFGQALVGNVFPVFLADEIDGDLSAKRREATLQALVSLKKHLKQIILVTHRGADIADHVWHVEENTQ